jgi:hypothetical protein
VASDYGPSVLLVTGPDGDVLRDVCYGSPSALKTGDPRKASAEGGGSEGGCAVKYWFQYVEKKKPPSTKAQETGTALHADLERYVLTGARDISELALCGLHMVPPPDAYPPTDLAVELDMGASYIEAHAKRDPELAGVLLVARDLRLLGRYTEADALLRAEGLLSLSGLPVLGRIDMVHARGLNYGAADVGDVADPPGTIEVIDWKTSSDVNRYAKTPGGLARDLQMLAYGRYLILQAARLGLPGSAGAALAWLRLSHGYFQTRGRRLTRKVSVMLSVAEICDRWEQGAPVARTILDAARSNSAADVEPNLDSCDAYGGCPHRAYCPHSTSRGLSHYFPASGLVRPAKQGASLMGFLDNLRAADMKKSADAVDPKVAAAWKIIKDAAPLPLPDSTDQIGYPATSGDAAKIVASIEGWPPAASGFGGAGTLGKATITTADEICSLAGEVADLAAAARSAAPATTPATPTTPTTPATPPATTVPISGPDTPDSDPASATVGPDGGKKKSAKPPAAKKPADKPADKSAAAAATGDSIGGALVFVDCVPSCVVTRLEPALLELARKLAEEASAELGVTVNDIRACEAKPLGFGGWKGIYSAAVRAMELPPGPLMLDARGSELFNIAAEALRERAGLYTRGI